MTMQCKEGYFRLERDTPIVLYGAATTGVLLYDHLTQMGYRNIIGFIDKRADEVRELLGLPVFSVDDDRLDKNWVILLAVKNVFEHGRIAAGLERKGFSRLLYRPYACLSGGGSHNEREIYDIYDQLTETHCPGHAYAGPVPESKGKAQIQWHAEGILSEENGIVTAYIPITLLFTDRKDGNPEFSVLFLKPHMKFVRYVMGLEGGGTEDYIRFCQNAAERVGGFETTQAWKENVVRNRAEVYIQMNHMYALSKDFFLQQAPSVQWNAEKCYFNLQSGKHRATFLAAKGENYIAVKMSAEDYRAWSHSDFVPTVGALLAGRFYEGTAIPVENPFFYGYSCFEEQFWYQLIRTVMETAAEVKYKDAYTDPLANCHFFVDIQDCGFVKRFLHRCGFQIHTHCGPEELEASLDQLQGFSPFSGEPFGPETYVDLALVDENAPLSEDEWDRIHKCFVIAERERPHQRPVTTGIRSGRKVWVYLEDHDSF